MTPDQTADLIAEAKRMVHVLEKILAQLTVIAEALDRAASAQPPVQGTLRG